MVFCYGNFSWWRTVIFPLDYNFLTGLSTTHPQSSSTPWTHRNTIFKLFSGLHPEISSNFIFKNLWGTLWTQAALLQKTIFFFPKDDRIIQSLQFAFPGLWCMWLEFLACIYLAVWSHSISKCNCNKNKINTKASGAASPVGSISLHVLRK